MSHPAQVIQPARVPAQERLALFFREVDVGERPARVGPESIAERLVLLQAVEHHVRLVAAHATSHSSAARPTRPTSPSNRTRPPPGPPPPRTPTQLTTPSNPPPPPP